MPGLWCSRIAHALPAAVRDFRAGSIGDGYDVVTCDVCGACFASGLPDEERFNRYYAESSKYDLGGGVAQLTAADIDRFADQAAFVAAHVAERNLPALDVGTATGGFLLALRNAGFTRPYGVEPSPDAVRVARDTFGLEVNVGGLLAAKALAERFGLISYLEVLEHVLEPRGLVRATGTFLEPGGHLFVSVPDAGEFPDHVDAPFQEFSVEHINYFTGHSLANLMAAEGFTLVAQRSVVLPLGADGHGPALEAIYRRDRTAGALQPDPSDADPVREYVRLCLDAETRTIARIADLASSGSPIYVWGTGTHTLHLLRVSRLGECAIEAFIDSNPHYAGSTLAGRPVVSPADLAGIEAPILVSSAVSQASIATAARERFGPDVPLILLY